MNLSWTCLDGLDDIVETCSKQTHDDKLKKPKKMSQIILHNEFALVEI